MSGGGGRDWSEVGRPGPRDPGSGGGSGGGGQPDPCDIVSVTNLNSPNPAAIRTFRPGDVLQVAYQAGPPRLLLATTSAGVVAGSITSAEMPRIIACINKGVGYVAEVLSVRGGLCQVRVHR